MTPSWIWPAGQGRDIELGDLLGFGLSQTPDKIAISDRNTTYSFAALEALAVAYAHDLFKKGIGPGDGVMILARKICQMPALAIALWKLGAVYMPVDADLPAARLDLMIARAAPKLIVHFGPVTGQFLGVPTADFAQVTAQDGPTEWRHASHHHTSDDIAYVIHTSGSTGAPKGVQITAQSLKAYFHAHNAMLRLGPNARVFSLTPFHFDVSIEDTLLPLSLGGFVHQYSGIPQGAAMRRAIARHEITHLIAVSTLLTIIADQPDAITRAAFPALEMVMTGAELCAPAVINLWKTQMPDLRVFNVYGPTEVTIVCTGYEIETAQIGRTTAYPIGKPLDGVATLLRDDQGVVISAPETEGELCLGGAQVMAGYLGDPEATAQRIFLHDGVRFYRSGDRCSRDTQGNYHFAGRGDAEVKLNGRRINLAEVQAECMAVAGVKRAAVGLVTGPMGSLVIGVVLVSDLPDAVALAQARTRASLPQYLQPAVWKVAAAHHLGSTGKTDDRSLLAQFATASQPHLDRLEIVK
jgi:amino acid adenylation domain-containing protein